MEKGKYRDEEGEEFHRVIQREETVRISWSHSPGANSHWVHSRIEITTKIINSIAAWQGWSQGGWEWNIPMVGAIGGALAGVILALLMDFILRKSNAWLLARTQRESITKNIQMDE